MKKGLNENMNIRKKISIPMITLAIGGCLIVLISSILLYISELNNTMEDKVYVALNVAQHELIDIKEQVRFAAIGMSTNRELTEAFTNNDRDAIINFAYNLKAMIGLDYYTFVGSDSNIIFCSNEPETYGDSMMHLPYIEAAFSGETQEFVFSGAAVRFGLSAAAPVYDEDGAVAGVISVGRMLDTPVISEKLKELTGCEVTIFFGDERVSTTLKDENGKSVLGTTAEQHISAQVLERGGYFLGKVNLFGKILLSKYAPLYDADDTVAGMLFVGYYTAADMNKIIVFILNGILITLAVFLACFIIARLVSGIFERQVEGMVNEIRESRDAAETANNAKSSFLANMSHEVRTPMNAILGITDILMQSENIPTEFEEGLVKIYSSCNMLLGIINDILDFSKIEAGKLKIATAEYNIASLISDSVQLNMMRTESKPIEFELQASENLPANLVGDELRIKQILNNLLSNAFKYTDTGRITLTVNFELSEYDNIITLLIGVRDTGSGMTPEQTETLFAEYSRFAKENSRVEGTGLGLAITHRLLNLMGGGITVVSEPGNGSLFSVRLPQRKANNRILGKDTASNLRHFRFSHHIHNKYDRMIRNPMPYGNVLIVDDVENNLYVGVGLMKPYKLRIDTVMSGKEALEKIKKNTYDVIFMDHMMPGMSGIEAVSHMRAAGYKSAVIALTANAVAGAAEMFLNSGFDDFISKPIDLRQLDLILNKYVRDKQPPEVLEAASAENINGINNIKHLDTGIIINGEIAGLDVGKGLKRYNDDIKIYLQVLRSFASSVLPMLEAIEIADVSEDNLAEYKIKAHGIKGASFNVYAEKIGKKAEELEKAATAGDVNYIKSNNAKFIKTARKLVSDIEAMLDSADAGDTKPEKNQPENGALSQLLAACLNYDINGVDAAMEEIEKYRYESEADNELSFWLRESVNMMKFKQIAEKLEERGVQ
ncbi:MAG: cache domain-containing protein [Oscillospiraceae bacterium]|nr:cache domain-containing protein [Oscillospiraceae bacterium]